MTQHTQGQWKCRIDEFDDWTLFTGDLDGKHTMIGEIYGDTPTNGMPEVRTIPKGDESKANAMLTAQSPAMHLFITEFVSALKDKSKLTTWEKALLHGAEEILKATT